jgi:hypothetical protein
MGYYTDYELTIKDDINAALLGDNDRLDEIEEFLTKDKEHYFAELEPSSENNSAYFGNMKWYDHEGDMKMLSSQFRDILFELYGRGEEDNDRWTKYFLNGKMQICLAKITVEYPEFDLSRMK